MMCVIFYYDKNITTNSKFVNMELKIPYYSTSLFTRQVNSGVQRTKYQSNIYVKELVQPDENGRTIVSSTSTHEKGGLVWSNIQLTHLDSFVKRTKMVNTVLKIQCLGCIFKNPKNLDENPVLTFQVSESSKPKQNNCDSTKSRCCREEYNLDWDTLGWSDWVILPKSLEIGRCVGTCDHVDYKDPLKETKISHKHILKVIETKYMKDDSDRALCCGPTKSEPARILYTDGKTISMKTLRNARILECGCA